MQKSKQKDQKKDHQKAITIVIIVVAVLVLGLVVWWSWTQLQGAFREHQNALEKCGVKTCQIRKASELKDIDALVIPGGESTTMIKLLNDFDLAQPIVDLARQGMPIFGTCAGLILLAKHIRNSQQQTLGLMDIEVERNAYGSRWTVLKLIWRCLPP